MKNLFILESQIYSSLSHPKRLEILHLLSHGTLTVSDIEAMTSLSQAGVSQHLMVLKKLKLVKVEKHGKQRIYSLASDHIPSLFDVVRSVLLDRFGVQEIDRLNRYHLHTDPICGMEITAKNAAASLLYKQHRYYFCGLGCEKKFIKKVQLNDDKILKR